MNLGILVDITAIVAVTVLALAGQLPSSVTTLLVGIIVAARFNPPAERAAVQSMLKRGGSPPSKPPTLPPGASGLVTLLWGLSVLFRR